MVVKSAAWPSFMCVQTDRFRFSPDCAVAITRHACAPDGLAEIAVRKVTAGLRKLVFPHRTDETLTEEELDHCLSVAVECRERVLAQLAVMAPGEFSAGKLQVRAS